MKFTVLFLSIACITASAHGYSQITLTETNTPIQKVFKKIELQSGYEFLYTTKMIQYSNTVDVSVKDASIKEVLSICFKDQPFTYSIVEQTIVVKQKLLPPIQSGDAPAINPQPINIDVRDRIVNETGDPVMATIAIKGSNKATSTNENGEFELKDIDENAVLHISGVSIESFDVKLNGRNNLALLYAKNKSDFIGWRISNGEYRLPANFQGKSNGFLCKAQ